MKPNLTREQKLYSELSDDLGPIVVAMFKRLRSKLPKHGLTYRTASSSYLLNRLNQEIRRLRDDLTEQNAIDVANFAVFLAYTIRAQKGEGKP